ncbi:isoleucine--tRNA ligase [Jatrophihabitans sp. YIM 134969]
MSYQPVPPHVDLPTLDHEVIDFWRTKDVFERTLARTADGPEWTFYEGPPTANGMPGTHHVEARVFKDALPRFRTMKGYHVPRRAGWDCHGLPVELAVEKELGFTGKPDIEKYGVAEFNARCRESVTRHVDAFEVMSERMGYWADYEHAYWTMDPAFVQSVWWALKSIFDQGLLVEDYRVTPYCPRCGTGLSSHELGQDGVYSDVVDPSVYVRFALTSGPWAGRADLLVWTTTPWTLVSNTAVAVNPEVTYVVVEAAGSTFVVAEPRLAAVAAMLGEESPVEIGRLLGADMERWTYQRPFDLLEFPTELPGGAPAASPNIVVLADYVTTDDGSGLVHQAPAFGADDLAVCRRYDLPVMNPIGPDGRFLADVPLVGGQFFKDADAPLVADLEARGLLAKHLPYEHSYPHCWRCGTSLLYYALPSWYIRTTQRSAELIAENEATTWFPASIKHGRYGDWLANNVDWALSRDRYWGTPLPIWRNDADPSRLRCIGSLAELGELAGTDLSALDPHRPFVDDVTFTVDGEDGVYRRVPQVIDGWFDSGSMPFAQFGAPWQNAEEAAAAYPADFICEAIDQTRGWFYSLMVVGTLVNGRNSYKNVVCLGHIMAEDGRKMSKHLGNILEPLPLMDRHGADALRWFMAASGSPWSQRRVGHKALEEIASKVLRTYWSIASFQALYAGANGWSPDDDLVALSNDSHVLDRYLLQRTRDVTLEVDAAWESFDIARAGRALSELVDDVSNWYVRRSRRRFWDGDAGALSALHRCLHVTTRLLAPLVPFITERVWQDLFKGGDDDSVHLAAWPVDRDGVAADFPDVDGGSALVGQVALVRRLVELGRGARAASGVKTRQPLGRALVAAPGWDDLSEALRREVADELNVQELVSLHEGTGGLVDVVVKPNFRVLGKRFGPRMKEIAALVTGADPAAVAASVRAQGSVEIGGETFTAEELLVSESPAEGWAVERDEQATVALDLELTPELRRLGTLRDVVRMVQDARKGAGLEVTDRIALWWQVGGREEPALALREHGEALGAEVLATTVTEGRPDGAALPDVESPGTLTTDAGRFVTHDPDLGVTVWFATA